MARQIEEILKSATIRDLRLESGEAVSRSTSLGEVCEILDRRRFNAVAVCDDRRVVGIFTQRDLLFRVALERVDPDTPIGELMTPEPLTIELHQPLREAVRAMTERGFRNLPLVDSEGRWVGMVSSRNVLRYIAEHFPEALLNLPPRLNQQMPRPEGG